MDTLANMNDFVSVAMILILVPLGVFLTFWSKKSAMLEAKINLSPWYRIFPDTTTWMYGKKENLENSFAIKLVTWWHRFVGILTLLFALFFLLALLTQ